MCTLGSFVNWLAATNRRSPELLHKHCIRPFKTLISWTLEAYKVFGQWYYKVPLLYKCSNSFPTTAKTEKVLKFVKVINLPLINHLSWYGAVCSRPRFRVQQQDIANKGSYKTGAFKVSSWIKPHVPNWFAFEGIKQKAVSKAYSWVDKNLSYYRIKLLKSQTLNLNGVETEVSLSNFARKLRPKNSNVPVIYFAIFDTAGTYPTLVLYQKAQGKETGSWVPFKIWTSEAACKSCTRRSVRFKGLWVTLWKLAIYQYQGWENSCMQNLTIQNLLLPHVSSREWRYLLDITKRFCVWT